MVKEEEKLTQEQGKRLVKYARENIEEFVKENKKISLNGEGFLEENRGLFVTIKTKEGKLRGCIGRPYPNQSLGRALVDASASATRDPRFPPLGEDELREVEIEVTVLTKPEEVEVNDLEQAEKKIELGEDGLIVRGKHSQGLLLPQVPIENDMNLEEFLDHTCRKAGFLPGAWKKEDIDLLKFQGQIFSE